MLFPPRIEEEVRCMWDGEPVPEGEGWAFFPLCSEQCANAWAANHIRKLFADIEADEPVQSEVDAQREHERARRLLREYRRSQREQPDIESVRDRIGTCQQVLEDRGHKVRGKMAFCPFHENSHTPAMSLFTAKGKSRAKCHGCDWSGDALDLASALDGRPWWDL